MSTDLNVTNIHCGACATRVANAIRKVEPGAEPNVDVATGRVTIPGAVADVPAVLAALEKAGYPATLAQ